MAGKLDDIQAKRDKLATAIKEVRVKHSAETGWDSEESRAQWDKVNGEYSDTLKELESEQKKIAEAEAVEARMRQLDEDAKRGHNPHGFGFGKKDTLDEKTELQKELAFRGFLRGRTHASTEEKEAMRAAGMDFSDEVSVSGGTGNFYSELAKRNCFYNSSREKASRDLQSLPWEARALGAQNFTAGGSTVAKETMRSLEVNLVQYGSMRQAAQTLVTSGGNPLTLPTVSDTSNSGSWIGENVQISSSDPSFDGVTLYAHKCTSSAILISEELMEDSGVDIAFYAMDMLARRIGITTETAFATGDGAGKPNGMLTLTDAGVTAASTTAFTRSEIERLIYSVDPAYRGQAGCGFMMHDAIMAQCRIVTDSEGRYLWVNGTDPNMGERLGGYPVFINQQFPSAMTTGIKVMAFGLLKKYIIRRAGAIRMYRLNERYRDYDQTGFVAFVREDGNMLDAGTNPVRHLALA